ncbi:MAG: hypothetical protein KME07_21410 [Pegethrix bostrychoides GSE-TBD4-15B]|uniref:Uncharacterized protein n=1 Tax=Pegethrix bostrychoides GSE-TBD4-15B TaxID=2839662 RepID=A0A951PE29_9CYAN|nr:hypothetical protein [Pegethrix bostrychoides GSE-TBD4-15B]
MNESAFPSVVPDVSLEFSAESGLTKRELFAGLALAGLLAAGGDAHVGIVRDAVNTADLLIAYLSGNWIDQ